MKKLFMMFALSGIVLASCSKDDDDNNDNNNNAPREVSMEEAASGTYSMSGLQANLNIEFEAPFLGKVDIPLNVQGRQFNGNVSFTNNKVIFDVTMVIDYEFTILGQPNADTDDGSVTARMSYEILPNNRLRCFVQDGTDDEPFVFFNGLEIDDITFIVTERLNTGVKMRANVDTEIDFGGIIPGAPAGDGLPTVGQVFIDLKR
jgi:hypothetical protein